MFESLELADKADVDWYAALSPQERLDMALELIARHHEGHDETSAGFARVCHIVELSQS